MNQLYSAKFKRDWVALFAVSFFFFIVFSEFVLALGIPLLIKHATFYAEQEARQRMLDQFDLTRHMTYDGSGFPGVGQERGVLLWDLDLLALYLRRYAPEMSLSEINETALDIQAIQTIVARQNETGAYCRELKLSTDAYLEYAAKRLSRKASSK